MPRRNNVINGDSLDFGSLVMSSKPVFVMFYAKWCGHCRSLHPEFQQAANDMNNTPIGFVAIDMDKRPDVAQAAGISGFPTLRLYQTGSYRAYEGPRDADHMVRWLVR